MQVLECKRKTGRNGAYVVLTLWDHMNVASHVYAKESAGNLELLKEGAFIKMVNYALGYQTAAKDV